MPDESTIDLKGPGPFRLGLANTVSISISSDKQYVGLFPEFTVQRDGKTETISIEIVLSTEDAMALLLTLQDTQRQFGFPLPSISIATRTNQ
jgi:hypothetical protein